MNFSCFSLSNPISLTDNFTFLHSGISPMDLGLFDECLRNPNTSYFLTNIYFNTTIPIPISNGFCLNKNCSANDVTLAVNELLKLANTSAVGKATLITGNEGTDTINGSTVFVIFIMCSIAVMGLIYLLYIFFKIYFSMKNNSDNDIILKENSDNEIALIQNVKNESVKAGSILQLKKENDPLLEFIKCFSITDNWKKLWEVREGPLDFLNGVKSLAFFYVILGHEFAVRGLILPKNPKEAFEIMKADFFEFLAAGFYAVDVFFWLGGFFVALVLLDEKKYL